LIIGNEKETHLDEISKVHSEAFDGKGEVEIIQNLRQSGLLALSLVAIEDQQVIGHIAYSPAWILGDKGQALGIDQFLVLGPMAVLPSHQNRGIGTKLVEQSLQKIDKKTKKAVFVLGHPHFYSRFGFKPALETFQITSEFQVPSDVFMAKELVKDALKNQKGVVRYPDPFYSS
jgi:putative acetyltransferase